MSAASALTVEYLIMKVLYINKTFSGSMARLARFVGQNKSASSVFMAERWPRESQVPGVMLMRIPEANIAPIGHEGIFSTAQAIEGLLLRSAGNAANVAAGCMRLRKSGFTPDVIYTTAHGGYSQNVGDIFPKARLVTRSDWYYPPREPGASNNKEAQNLTSYERMFNILQLLPLMESATGITSSHWQKTQFGELVKDKMQVVHNGVDTRLFAPSGKGASREVVTFSCQGTSQVRGINTICDCLPELLVLRPHCRVNLVSFASRRGQAAKEQHTRELAGMLPDLNKEQHQRISIVVLPEPEQYCALLQQSTLYVYLTAPAQLTAGILEAMSCGALVLASATKPVAELLQHKENGMLWRGHDAHSLAFEIAELCSHAEDFHHIRRNARDTILSRHDVRRLIPQHADTVLAS